MKINFKRGLWTVRDYLARVRGDSCNAIMEACYGTNVTNVVGDNMRQASNVSFIRESVILLHRKEVKSKGSD